MGGHQCHPANILLAFSERRWPSTNSTVKRRKASLYKTRLRFFLLSQVAGEGACFAFASMPSKKARVLRSKRAIHGRRDLHALTDGTLWRGLPIQRLMQSWGIKKRGV